MSKIAEEFLLINKKMIPITVEKWIKDMNRQFIGNPKKQTSI